MEFEQIERAFLERQHDHTEGATKESLWQRKYLLPFALACMVLSFNQLTGVNSIIGYNTSILLQSGLSDVWAHWGYFIFTLVNFLATIVGMLLVDRIGRKALLSFGSGGIIVALVIVGTLFSRTEQRSVNVENALQWSAAADGSLSAPFDVQTLSAWLHRSAPGAEIDAAKASFQVIYTCGDYTSSIDMLNPGESEPHLLQLSRSECLPGNTVEAFFKNPFGNLGHSRQEPLHAEKAILSAVPTVRHGMLVASGLCLFMACFASGPGVCVWLALSELMPTRIRSNGMSVALLLNQTISTLIAGFFLPVVARIGYSHMFYLFAVFTVGYLLCSAFILPETKGKTLEEIERLFENKALPR